AASSARSWLGTRSFQRVVSVGYAQLPARGLGDQNISYGQESVFCHDRTLEAAYPSYFLTDFSIA
ncbi:MAG: hypothetical protein AAB401_23135, partial [Acidobacteriota bacterium]